MQIRYEINAVNFLNVSGNPFAYWVSKTQLSLMGMSEKIKDFCQYTGSLNKTGDNDKYLRFNWEISKEKFLNKWVPYNKGGRYRKWYGNNDLLIDVSENALHFYKTNKTSNLLINKFWFGPAITWTSLTSGHFNARFFENEALSDFKGASIFPPKNDVYSFLAYMNSSTFNFYANIIAPTLDYNIGQIVNVPFRPTKLPEEGVQKSEECVKLVKNEWDSFETSWDFKRHPLI